MDFNLPSISPGNFSEKNERTSDNPLVEAASNIVSVLDDPGLDVKPDYDEDLKNDILTYYESMFWLNSSVPTHADVKERFELTDKEFETYYNLVEEPLKNRGVKLPPLHPPVKNRRGGSELDPFFAMACSLICDTADKRSTAAKLKSLGLTTKQWQALLRQPGHADYFQKRLNIAFGDTEHAAKLSLAKNVESGDLQSIKYYHEFTGKYKPQNETNLNLVFLLGRLMEILSKRIDPAVLAEIADEIETVIDIKEIESGN